MPNRDTRQLSIVKKLTALAALIALLIPSLATAKNPAEDTPCLVRYGWDLDNKKDSKGKKKDEIADIHYKSIMESCNNPNSIARHAYADKNFDGTADFATVYHADPLSFKGLNSFKISDARVIYDGPDQNPDQDLRLTFEDSLSLDPSNSLLSDWGKLWRETDTNHDGHWNIREYKVGSVYSLEGGIPSSLLLLDLVNPPAVTVPQELEQDGYDSYSSKATNYKTSLPDGKEDNNPEEKNAIWRDSNDEGDVVGTVVKTQKTVDANSDSYPEETTAIQRVVKKDDTGQVTEATATRITTKYENGLYPKWSSRLTEKGLKTIASNDSVPASGEAKITVEEDAEKGVRIYQTKNIVGYPERLVEEGLKVVEKKDEEDQPYWALESPAKQIYEYQFKKEAGGALLNERITVLYKDGAPSQSTTELGLKAGQTFLQPFPLTGKPTFKRTVSSNGNEVVERYPAADGKWDRRTTIKWKNLNTTSKVTAFGGSLIKVLETYTSEAQEKSSEYYTDDLKGVRVRETYYQLPLVSKIYLGLEQKQVNGEWTLVTPQNSKSLATPLAATQKKAQTAAGKEPSASKFAEPSKDPWDLITFIYDKSKLVAAFQGDDYESNQAVQTKYKELLNTYAKIDRYKALVKLSSGKEYRRIEQVGGLAQAITKVQYDLFDVSTEENGEGFNKWANKWNWDYCTAPVALANTSAVVDSDGDSSYETSIKSILTSVCMQKLWNDLTFYHLLRLGSTDLDGDQEIDNDEEWEENFTFTWLKKSGQKDDFSLGPYGIGWVTPGDTDPYVQYVKYLQLLGRDGFKEAVEIKNGL